MAPISTATRHAENLVRSARELVQLPLRKLVSGAGRADPRVVRAEAMARAFRLGAVYVLVAAAWILFSDTVLERLVGDSAATSIWQTGKGLGFVLVTGALLVVLVYRHAGSSLRAQVEAQQARELLGAYIDSTPLAILAHDRNGRVVLWNEGAERMFGWTEEEALGLVRPTVPPRLRAEFERDLEELRRGERITARRTTRNRKDGSEIEVSLWAAPLRDDDGTTIGTVLAYSDLTEWIRAQAEIRRQVERLESLRLIDQAINASMDLDVTLGVVLDQVVGRLGAAGAAVLLLSRGSSRLRLAASRGLNEKALRERVLRVGEGMAGWVALERRTTSFAEWVAGPGAGADARVPPGGWSGYWAAPLVAKGEVVGVLEVVLDQASSPAPDWIPFLEALASQTAIAIDNARLFEDLQRSNAHLRLAYDATLEGWARALDLRDRETEGHSRRVTEACVRLARRCGIEGEALVHIRRGALLHDIGKMGVPDRILLKPGPLTEEEWEVMKRHPVHAYELLSPIGFLRPALDIPYAHHERWDGTGYPRGLAGEEIPLAARIFAVVDVWDALRSDRPYRDAWPDDRIREHLAACAGTHFDPDIVRVFLEMDWGDRPGRR